VQHATGVLHRQPIIIHSLGDRRLPAV